MNFSGLIDPLKPASGPPPRQLWPFIRWSLSGAWGVIWIGVIASMVTGLFEALVAVILGWVIDAALAAGPQVFFAEYWPQLLGVALFFLILRPGLMVLNAAMTSLAIAPQLFPQVILRVHRHTLGQSIRFFDDDFAGRLAQKEMQAANSITEIVVETVNAMAFALITVGTTAFLLGRISIWMGVFMVAWLATWVLLVRWLLPLIRARSKARAAARAALSGQIVDTMTNMATVKLFAHGPREEEAATASINQFRDAAIGYGRMAVLFRSVMMTFAGTLPVALIGSMLWLWQLGRTCRLAFHPHRPDDRLDQLHCDEHLQPYRRSRGRHAHPLPAPSGHGSARRRRAHKRPRRRHLQQRHLPIRPHRWRGPQELLA